MNARENEMLAIACEKLTGDLAWCCPDAEPAIIAFTCAMVIWCMRFARCEETDQRGCIAFCNSHVRALRGLMLCGAGSERSLAGYVVARFIPVVDALYARTWTEGTA